MRLGAVACLFAAGIVLAGCLDFGGSPDPVGSASSFEDATGILFYNAAVWTGDPEYANASAVAVRDGEIVGVGTHAELSSLDLGTAPLSVDLGGRMIMPGFIDTHSHFIDVGRRMAPSEGNPYEPWAPGWDLVMGTAGQQQTALGHIGVWGDYNMARLMRGELPAPPAARGADHGHDGDAEGEGHDHSHGLTEVLVEQLRERLAAMEGPLDGGDPDVVAAAQAGLLGDTLDIEGRLQANDLGFGYRDDASTHDWLTMLRRGLETGARYGVTSHVEAGIGLEAFDVLERLDEDGALTARFNLYVFPEDLDTVVSRNWTTGYGNDKARLLGLKIYSDGWLGPRTAALSEIYNDRPHRGFMFYTQEEIDDYVLRAHQNGLKLTAHTIGDRAADMLLTAYENAAQAGCDESHRTCEDPRFTLEHVQLVPPALLDRMVALDLVPSIQMSFATSDSPWAEMAVGPERLEQAYIWRTMTEAGLTLGGSSDFPIEVLPPLWGVQRMVTRMELDGTPEGGFQPQQALDLDAVLRMVTINAAYLTYQEDVLGSITPGKWADLVVLEHDLFQVPQSEIHRTRVELTMVGGEVVHLQGGLGL